VDLRHIVEDWIRTHAAGSTAGYEGVRVIQRDRREVTAPSALSMQVLRAIALGVAVTAPSPVVWLFRDRTRTELESTSVYTGKQRLALIPRLPGTATSSPANWLPGVKLTGHVNTIRKNAPLGRSATTIAYFVCRRVHEWSVFRQGRRRHSTLL
jgi:hypothetical protein